MTKEAKRFDSAVKKQEGSKLDISANSKMFKDFRYALDNKVWLRSEPIQFEGEMIDMAQFEFMMATLKLPQSVNRYDLQQFYASLWPYIKKIIDSYESLDQGFETIVFDQQEVLNKYAEQSLELKLYKKFYKDLPNEYRMKFKKYKQEHEERIEEQKKEALEREEKFRADKLSKQEQKALERKFGVR